MWYIILRTQSQSLFKIPFLLASWCETIYKSFAGRNTSGVCDVLLTLNLNSGFFPRNIYLFNSNIQYLKSVHARYSTVGYTSARTSHIIQTPQTITTISSTSVPVPIIRTKYSRRSYKYACFHVKCFLLPNFNHSGNISAHFDKSSNMNIHKMPPVTNDCGTCGGIYRKINTIVVIRIYFANARKTCSEYITNLPD